MSRMIIDLTRGLGAKMLEEKLFLYSVVDKLKYHLESYIDAYKSKSDSTREFFSTNLFVQGGRGSGKTSVLITLRENLKTKKEEGKKFDNDFAEIRNHVEVLEIIDVSVSFEGILIHLITHIKNFIHVKKDSCCNDNLYKLSNLVKKLELTFPLFFKYFCSNLCKVAKEYDDISSMTEFLNVKIIKDIDEMVELYLKVRDKKKLVILLDDIDLIPDSKVLLRTFIELGFFLNRKDIIIIGAGDRNILETRLRNAISKYIFDVDGSMGCYDNNGNDSSLKGGNLARKNIEIMINQVIRSLYGKVFPENGTVELPVLSNHTLRKIKVKYKDKEGEKEITLKEFFQRSLFMRHIDEEFIYPMLSNLSLREFVILLLDIQDVVNYYYTKQDKSYDIKISNLMISKNLVEILAHKYHFVMYLFKDFDITLSDLGIKVAKDGIQFIDVKEVSNDRDKNTGQIVEYFKNMEEFTILSFRNILLFISALSKHPDIKEVIKKFWDYSLDQLSRERYIILMTLKKRIPDLFYLFLLYIHEIVILTNGAIIPLLTLLWDTIYYMPSWIKKILKKTKKNATIKNNELRDLLLQFSAFNTYAELDEYLNILYNELFYGKHTRAEYILHGKVRKYSHQYKKTGIMLYYHQYFLNLFISTVYATYYGSNLEQGKDVIKEYVPYVYDLTFTVSELLEGDDQTQSISGWKEKFTNFMSKTVPELLVKLIHENASIGGSIIRYYNNIATTDKLIQQINMSFVYMLVKETNYIKTDDEKVKFFIFIALPIVKYVYFILSMVDFKDAYKDWNTKRREIIQGITRSVNATFKATANKSTSKAHTEILYRFRTELEKNLKGEQNNSEKKDLLDIIILFLTYYILKNGD